MVTRAPFLTMRYGAYLHSEVPEEDVELSHVGRDTSCAEYLRRFWRPICLSDELKDLPHRVKILGEELVVFRDRSGAVGLLELHCPHRGASLEFGLIDAKGIRCCYHGWLFAADGTVLETPGDPVGLCRDAGVVIPTYCNDTVLRMPPDMDPVIDRQRVRETGRRLAESYLKDPRLLTSARRPPELPAPTAR